MIQKHELLRFALASSSSCAESGLVSIALPALLKPVRGFVSEVLNMLTDAMREGI